MQRIVNIYSVNSNYKKKKFVLSNNGSVPNYQPSNPSIITNPSQVYKGDDIKLKLQQLREGIGYYDGKNRESSSENHNNSVLLPELKSITPHL
jgi:hypothetical protein